MAKKDENEFRYGSSFLPEGERKYSVIRWGWNGLNRTDDIDTGQLSDAMGVIVDPPYVYPAKPGRMWVDFVDGIPLITLNYPDTPGTLHSGTPITIFGTDKYLTMVWRDNDDDKFRFSKIGLDTRTGKTLFVNAELGDSTGVDEDDLVPRSIVQFNVVDTSSGNVVEYEYDRKLLIYPDCYSVPYAGTPSQAQLFNTEHNPVPEASAAAVYGSRVFGVTDDAVFGSAFNSYVDYTLDTADDVSSAHAWWSMSQSNTDADGEFTAMTTYDNHVVLFKKDFMQLVYNNKNPFRIVDVGAFGCDNSRAVCEMGGVLYFASKDKVYAFTGGTPKDISKKLEVGDLTGASLGAYKDVLWMQTKNGLYQYRNGVWSDVTGVIGGNVQEFATLDYGLVALVKEHVVLEGDPLAEWDQYSLQWLDWDVDAMNPAPEDPSEWEPEYAGALWWFETDLMALGKLDVRRVKKVSVLCDGKEDAYIGVCLLPDGIKVPHINPYGEVDAETSELIQKYNVGVLQFNEDGIKMLRVLARQFSSTMHRLFFYGQGYVKVYAAELKIAWGGDLYVES